MNESCIGFCFGCDVAAGSSPAPDEGRCAGTNPEFVSACLNSSYESTWGCMFVCMCGVSLFFATGWDCLLEYTSCKGAGVPEEARACLNWEHGGSAWRSSVISGSKNFSDEASMGIQEDGMDAGWWDRDDCEFMCSIRILSLEIVEIVRNECLYVVFEAIAEVQSCV